jgi:hypothetical protein
VGWSSHTPVTTTKLVARNKVREMMKKKKLG